MSVTYAAGLMPRLPRRQRKQAAEIPTAFSRLRTSLADVGHVRLADELLHSSDLSDIDAERIRRQLEQTWGTEHFDRTIAHLRRDGARAFTLAERTEGLPQRTRDHDVGTGQVVVGRSTSERRNPAEFRGRSFALDIDSLRTGLLAVGPPGSGKTTSVARPVIEHLTLQALAGKASMLAIDVKGDDFAGDRLWDIEIDPLSPDPEWGFDLFGGSDDPAVAVDRLATALLPVGISADKQYFLDASRNALFSAVAPFHAAHDRYPSLHELLDLLSGSKPMVQSIRDRLDHRGLLTVHERHLSNRESQRSQRNDPAASVVEKLSALDRPALTQLFDHPNRFAMKALDQPVRVRLVLPEAEYPDAAQVLARLVVSQFVQHTTSRVANRDIFTCLIIDEAGRYIDDYVARGLQRVRSNNAGLVLLTQSLGDFAPELLRPIFASAGCKIAFGGLDPDDAKYFSDGWGNEWRTDIAVNRSSGASSGLSIDDEGRERHSETLSQQSGVQLRRSEYALWSAAEIAAAIPAGCALISLTSSTGHRIPPVLVDFRQR